jgi:hypothetical protein
MRRWTVRFLMMCTAAFTAWSCGVPTEACGPATCSGCCSASGQCEAGSSSFACGGRGGQCTSCSSGATCSLGTCLGESTNLSPGPAYGGGAAGGGSAGGAASAGGTATGCLPLTVSPSVPSATWVQYTARGSGTSSTVQFFRDLDPVTAISLDLDQNGSVAFPVTGTFSMVRGPAIVWAYVCPKGQSWAVCGSTQRFRYFQALSGTYTFERADTSTRMGFIRGSMSAMRLVEWEFPGGMPGGRPIGGGDCYDVPAFRFEGSW